MQPSFIPGKRWGWHLAHLLRPSHYHVEDAMKKSLSGIAILLLAGNLACNNAKENQYTGTSQSSKDEGTNGNTANTPAGGRNTSTGSNAIDKQNKPTPPASGSGSESNLAGTGSSDNGANPSPADSTRPHPKSTNEGKAATAPKK